ncbi:response regulator transcription factor [Hydrogenophaga sp. YM1]|jgi:two-component system response regulator DctR|uniref:response regulator transcription factor n=1 Tax=unclassified Hydrogenophaga TaxID=2610897 RepID=UPI00086F4250|nr:MULTISPECIES: response regulator [unclassified Hydrogenophaga]MBN9373184.1 response regulator transcription factor [Hydrogenophaga sp.]ODT31716.1 MAG: DNA-binding response regulator [Hydrogenophaga sp. SCN 70-13]OJV58368.1 MAG: DNA-binding response regulator [Hydrogenophaga sp. 70-12]QRR34247.1 response regulator transcription factor [Hydrogenophaga sp. YM1]
MTEFPDAKIYLVDDDAGVREALAWLLRTRRLISDGFDSAEDFLAGAAVARQAPDVPCCVLLDVRMPGMSGLALFEKLRLLPWQAAMPIIFLSGHADVATAVAAVKRGAFDFCEKPFSDNALVDRVEQALRQSAAQLAERAVRHELQQRLDSLTERERDVMNLVVAGLPNKLVADQLQISVRTVEVHRSRVFDKMGVKSAVELANRLRDA